MEIKKAKIRREVENTYLILEVSETLLELNLTDDNPNNVKQIFNLLLKELKKGHFNYNLEDDSKDLFNNICVEYITQLNRELSSIHTELFDYELLEN